MKSFHAFFFLFQTATARGRWVVTKNSLYLLQILTIANPIFSKLRVQDGNTICVMSALLSLWAFGTFHCDPVTWFQLLLTFLGRVLRPLCTGPRTSTKLAAGSACIGDPALTLPTRAGQWQPLPLLHLLHRSPSPLFYFLLAEVSHDCRSCMWIGSPVSRWRQFRVISGEQKANWAPARWK